MLYRSYGAAAVSGLSLSGHTLAHATVLIGELAPEGYEQPGTLTAMTPMPVLRALYCLDANYRPLRGGSASAVGCPSQGPTRAFVDHDPGFFSASGLAHHLYSFYSPPQAELAPRAARAPRRARVRLGPAASRLARPGADGHDRVGQPARPVSEDRERGHAQSARLPDRSSAPSPKRVRADRLEPLGEPGG